VDHIYANPESGLYMLYTDPDAREDPLSFILVSTSLVVKTAEAKQLQVEATGSRIDGMKAFQMDPAYAKTMMSTQKSEREKFVQDMAQGAVRATSRVHQAIHDLRITSRELRLPRTKQPRGGQATGRGTILNTPRLPVTTSSKSFC
jgi:hypothetical protein